MESTLMSPYEALKTDPRQVLLEVIDHEEYVEIDEAQVPIEGSRTAFLHLKASDGTVIRAQIPHASLDSVLALKWPEDFSVLV